MCQNFSRHDSPFQKISHTHIVKYTQKIISITHFCLLHCQQLCLFYYFAAHTEVCVYSSQYLLQLAYYTIYYVEKPIIEAIRLSYFVTLHYVSLLLFECPASSLKKEYTYYYIMNNLLNQYLQFSCI